MASVTAKLRRKSHENNNVISVCIPINGLKAINVPILQESASLCGERSLSVASYMRFLNLSRSFKNNVISLIIEVY